MLHNDPATANEIFEEGLRAAKSGQSTHAHECFTRTIELDPNHCLAYSERGAIKLRRYNALEGFHSAKLHDESFTQAIADFNKAIELNPNEIQTYYRRALTFKEIENYACAILDFLHVIENNGVLKHSAIKKLADMLDNASRSTIYRSIKQLQSTHDQIKLYEACLNEQTLLGTFFWKANIVGRKPKIDEAPLSKMKIRLEKLKAALLAPPVRVEDFFIMEVPEQSPPSSPLASPSMLFKRKQIMRKEKEGKTHQDIPLLPRSRH